MRGWTREGGPIVSDGRLRCRLRSALRSLITATALGISLASLAPKVSMAGGGQLQHGVSLADFLRTEEIGPVELDPSGARVLFQRTRLDAGDFSLETQSRMAGEIYVYDLKGRIPAHPLVSHREKWDGQRVIAFSPDGSRAVLNWLERGQLLIGVYDFATHRLTTLPFIPAYLQFFFLEQTLVWLSNDEFACSALPPGTDTGAVVYSRRAVERKLVKKWETAWAGRSSTSDVLESHGESGEEAWRPGKLLRVNIRTGAITTLAEGAYFGLSLSPDRRYLGAAQQGGFLQRNPTVPLRNQDYRADGRHYEPVMFDLLRGGPPTKLLPGYQIMLSRYTWVWGPGGDSVVFYGSDADQPWGQGRFWLYRAAAQRLVSIPLQGLVVPMERELIDFRFQEAIPLWDGIVVPALAKHSEIGWFFLAPGVKPVNLTATLDHVSATPLKVTPEALFILANGDVWRIERGGARQNITSAIQPKLAAYSTRVSVAERGRLASTTSALQVYTVDRHNLLQLDSNGQITSTIRVPVEIRQLFSISHAQGVGIIETTGAQASVLAVVSRDGSVHPFWTYNSKPPGRATSVSVKLTYALGDGSEASSVALLPTDWAAGHHVPVVVDVYPGQGESIATALDIEHPLSARLFASMGYAVLSPYLPEGKIGNGEDLLGNLAALVIPAVNELVRRGYADSQRVGLVGASAGGWSALALLTQTDRFRAAVAAHTTADFISYYGASSFNLMSELFPDEMFPASPPFDDVPGYHLSFGVPPWENPGLYLHTSPFFSVAKVHTPVMLVQADLDPISMDQLNQMFTALFRLRKEAQLVRYWGETHGVTSPANIRDLWARELAWMDKWCDLLRDADGHVVYGTDRPVSRKGQPALTPQQFLQWAWFFGSGRSEEDARSLSKEL